MPGAITKLSRIDRFNDAPLPVKIRYLRYVEKRIRQDFSFKYTKEPGSIYQEMLDIAYAGMSSGNPDVKSAATGLCSILVDRMPDPPERQFVRLPYKG